MSKIVYEQSKFRYTHRDRVWDQGPGPAYSKQPVSGGFQKQIMLEPIHKDE